MSRVFAWFHAAPFTMTVVASAASALIAMGASAVWAVKVQPDPQVIRRAEPVTNTGLNAQGLTLDQWIAAGNLAEQYSPVPKSRYRAGETLWILRQDCFVNKTASGIVYRSFLGGDRRDKLGDLDLTKQSGSQYILDPLPIPSRSDGCPVKNHRTQIPADLQAQTWTYASGVDFYKNMLQTSVRVWFRPVVIEVVR